MAQQPNIELGHGDLPRPELGPHAAAWLQDRPGEITRPEEVRWGGAFGRPGPDTGWALKLVASTDFDRGARPSVLEKVVANIAGARAAKAGRGPTAEDVEVALTLLGLRTEGLPDDVAATLGDVRSAAVDHAAHERDKGRSFIDSVPVDQLIAKPADLVRMLAE